MPPLPYPPAHYLAATSLWRLAMDAKCRPLLETQLALQQVKWGLAPCVSERSSEASAEPIAWDAERVIWIGWWRGGDGRAQESSTSTSSCEEEEEDDDDDDEGERRRARGPCYFGLLSQELMRCVARQLRPIGLRTEYIVLPAAGEGAALAV